MKSLREIQQEFASAILAKGPGPFASLLAAGDAAHAGAGADDRLDIYRNNVLHNYREALRSVYPVVERLVGARFFDHAADRYSRAWPSTSGDIHKFGDRFADFLAGFAPASALVYLPDTARLEWAMHEVFHAADHAPLPLRRLARLARCSDAALVFVLHPACRLFASRFPVDRIWALNQSDAEWNDTLDAGSGGVLLLVRRRDFVVELASLQAGEFTLLQCLSAGSTLARACDSALRAQPDFRAEECMRRHIMEATIVDFTCIDTADRRS